ncbi:MAG: cytochrome b/b6 domain-containing protein [Planctomycetes bacterium]|nr:cytochrome b/b6 domain-containing protein [Planctomycetota bacterium]
MRSNDRQMDRGARASRAGPSPGRAVRGRLGLWVTIVALLASSRVLATDPDCLACHSKPDLAPVTERGKHLNLHVAPDALQASPHADLSCTDCHAAPSFDRVPHLDGKPGAHKCIDCHEAVAKQYDASVHGFSFAKGDTSAATCASCHGGHDILPASDRKSRTNKFNLPATCGKCHQSREVTARHQSREKEAVPHFIDSIHGRALLVDGLIVAPNCNDCHGVHDILPASDPKSHIAKDQVPKTCGKCHVLVEEVYNGSIHGQLLAQFDKRGPTCITCHTSHEIDTPGTPEFRLKSDRKCGECHQDRLERYRDTFHGKAMALGRPGVATCYDCHGHHDIQKSGDPRSHIGAEHRLETCRRCHPEAAPNFADYIVHADHTDKVGHPELYWFYFGMTALLLGTFGFFAVHSVFWLYRSTVVYTGDSKQFREQKQKVRADREQYVRFRPVDRFLHGLVILSFLLLVITGMPLKFYYTDWARWLLDHMGGQEVASIVHRLGAMITIFYFAVHITEVLIGFWGGRAKWRDPSTGRLSIRRIARIVFGPDSPMPNFQDVRDFIAHQKWFFGKGPRPQFDRWTYWEKFDYLAVFWGVAIIGFSGLVMWYPEFFTRFLPGWAINAALIVHSDEALLAAGFIFTFHFFNVHFRPEKFPLDPVIFSGRISKTELLHERKRLYDRWVAEGELEKHAVGDEWESWRWIAIPAGFLAFCIGGVLVLLIYYAMFTRLAWG